jgi:hypothetical protein
VQYTTTRFIALVGRVPSSINYDEEAIFYHQTTGAPICDLKNAYNTQLANFYKDDTRKLEGLSQTNEISEVQKDFDAPHHAVETTNKKKNRGNI